MVYNEYINNYINNYPYDKPIFIKRLKEDIFKNIKKNKDQISKNINVILDRLEAKNIIKRYNNIKGIYYKTLETKFGEKQLDKYKVILYKYLKNPDDNIIGYVYGAKIFNTLGLTTQVPNVINIATNMWKDNNIYKDKNLNVIVRRPKIEVNNYNYLYLQLLDIIENKDNIPIEVSYPNKVIYNYIKNNNLNFEEILLYTKKTNNIKLIQKIINIIEEGVKK